MKRKLLMIVTCSILLLSCVLIPSTSAYANDSKADAELTFIRKSAESYLKEKGIYTNLTDDEIVEKLQEYNVSQMKTKIRPPEPPEFGTRGWDNVALGTDRTFYTADAGNKGKGSSGVATGIWNSDYTTSTRKNEAVTLLGPVGWGSAYAWASVGKLFYCSGGGSQSANIRMYGFYDGAISVFSAANCEATIELVLHDYTTSSTSSTTILSVSKGLAGYWSYYSSFNRTLPVLLQSGHYYCAYLAVHTSGSYYVLGECCSDFGPYDADPGYTDYSYIQIDF